MSDALSSLKGDNDRGYLLDFLFKQSEETLRDYLNNGFTKELKNNSWGINDHYITEYIIDTLYSKDSLLPLLYDSMRDIKLKIEARKKEILNNI